MHARDTILQVKRQIIISKAHVKFQLDWLKIFQEKVKKVKKINNIYSFYPNPGGGGVEGFSKTTLKLGRT